MPGKRKKTHSPAAKRNPKLRKVMSANKGTKPTSTPSQCSSQPQVATTISSPSLQPSQGKPVKPIFAETSVQVIKRIISSAQLSTPPLCKVRNSNSTQITCLNVIDKNNIIDKLKSQKIGFHSFTEPADKSPSFVLKGFYLTSCDELHNYLTVAGLSVKKVSYFIKKDDYAMYLIQLDTPTNINILNHSYRTIDGIIVKWENFKKTNNKVTQCYNCQRWGHSSLNCGLPPRCVKCAANHPKGDCPRTSREGDPVCCNCNGNHSSNHRGCPAFKQYTERINSHRRVHKPPANNFQINSTQFPTLSQVPEPGQVASNSVSFSQILKDSNNDQDLFSKFSNAQRKLNSIPGIKDSMNRFILMVDELSLCNDPSGHCLILTKYCLPNLVPYNGI